MLLANTSVSRYPQTLLGSPELESFYDSLHGDYFFDTNPEAFESVFDFYLYGKLYQPATIPNEMFQVTVCLSVCPSVRPSVRLPACLPACM